MKAKFETLHDLLILKLRSLYDIESELLTALPKMAKAATDGELKQAFEKHFGETENQVTRLEKALKSLDEKISKEKVEAIRGLAKDSAWIIKTIKKEEARDALLIAAGQYVEHYEMAGYGAAREWADLMGHAEVRDILQETLDEEKAANEKLNELAKGSINQRANVGMTPIERIGHSQ